MDIGLRAPMPELAERIVVLRGQTLPEGDARILAARADAVLAYFQNARYDEAETLARSIIEAAAATAASPARHEAVASAMDSLALVLVEQGRNAEAVQAAGEALAHVTGGDDPDDADPTMRANALSTLGYVHARTQQLEQALDYFRQAAALFEAGTPRHLGIQINIAAALGSLSRSDEALEVNQQLFDAMESRHGERHPQTLRVMNNLANNLLHLGRTAEALRWFERVVAVRTETLGSADPQTLRAQLNLGSAYTRVGRHDEALALLDSVVGQRRKQLGDQHLDTLNAMEVKAEILAALGRGREARALVGEVVDAVTGNRHAAPAQPAGAMRRSGSPTAVAISSRRGAVGAVAGRACKTVRRRASGTLSMARYRHTALTGLGEHEAAADLHRRLLQPLLEADPQTLDFQSRHLRQELLEEAAAGGN